MFPPQDFLSLQRALNAPDGQLWQKKKRPGRAKVLAGTRVQLKDGRVAKLVFVRYKRKQDWLALLSTDANVVRIYGKRWGIEVFFKMAKQHLKPAKEIQCRDFDAIMNTALQCVGLSKNNLAINPES